MDPTKLVILAFQVSLLLTVFGFGLQVTRNDVLYLVRRPGLLARTILAMFVIMPILMVAFVRFLDLPPALPVVLVALALSPVPPILPKQLLRAGGRHEYAYGLLGTMSLLAIVIVPVATNLLGRYLGRSLAVPWAVAKIVGLSIMLPLVVGMLVRRLLPAVADRIESPVSATAGVLLVVTAVVVVGGAWSALWALTGGGTLIALSAFAVAGLAIGHALGGPRPENRVVLALSNANRHPGIALALATANVSHERFGATILLYLLMSTLVGIPYVKWVRARTRAASAERLSIATRTRSSP